MFCKNCGKEVQDGAAFCMNCGAKIDPPVAEDPFKKAAENVFKAPADETMSCDARDISSNKGLAILSYFGLLVLVPLLAGKNSRFARFHANQGLVLMIGEVALSILKMIAVAVVKGIIRALSAYWMWFMVSVVSLVFSLAIIALCVFSIIGIVYAAQGKAKELPLIGKIKIIK